MAEVFTPWFDKAELIQTRDQLYSDGDYRHDAISRIEMWTMRGGCPHAVASSGLLADALEAHEEGRLSNTSIRCLLGSAVSRLVTGFCDIGQDSGSKAAMTEVAKEYGMPASFIELRHEFTHRELPSEARLERACREAMDWLWGFYWANLDGAGTEVHAEKAQQAQVMLKNFLLVRKQEVKGSADADSIQACCQNLKALCGANPNPAHSEMIAGCLSGSNTILIPHRRRLGDSMQGAYVLFDEFLVALCRFFPEVLAFLVKCMANDLTRETDPARPNDEYREALQLWLGHLFDGTRFKKSRRAYVQIQHLRLDLVRQCGRASRYPNEWSGRLCEDLLRTATMGFRRGQHMHAPSDTALRSISDQSKIRAARRIPATRG